MKNRPIFAFLLIGLLLAAHATEAFAQEQDSLRAFRWGIGLDALSLVDKNVYPDYSVFGRYLLNPDAEKNTFLRFRLGYDYKAILDTASSGISLDHSSRMLRYALALGVQKDLLVRDKSSLYMGGEIAFHNFRYKRDWGYHPSYRLSRRLPTKA